MKAIIENSVIFLNKMEDNCDLFTAFNGILQAITTSNTEEELRITMKNLETHPDTYKRFFDWGFGGSHMWVCQLCIPWDSNSEFINPTERIIIVEFDN